MNAVEIIAKKRDGEPLSNQEIAWFVQQFSNGDVPDYQVAAWAMAVFLNGMNPAEVAALTSEMLESGSRLEHVDDGRPLVDKHSTGGIGDKTSLVLAPLLACCDLRVPMLSGRGLGPTGGTLDKLESIADSARICRSKNFRAWSRTSAASSPARLNNSRRPIGSSTRCVMSPRRFHRFH